MSESDSERRRTGRSADQVLRATAKEELSRWMAVEPRSLEQIREFLEVHFARPVVRRTAERYRDWMVDGYGAVAAATRESTKGWIIGRKLAPALSSLPAQQLSRCARAIEWLEREGKRPWATAMRELLAAAQSDPPGASGAPAPSTEVVAVRPGPRVKPSAWIEAAIQRAIQSNRAIRVRYRLTKKSGSSGRRGRLVEAVIHPYGLVQGDRAFLVGGYDAAQGLERDAQGRRRIGWYLLDRFEKVEITDLPRLGHTHFDLSAYVQQWFGMPRGDEEPFDVEWRFSAQVADRAEQYVFHPSQTLRRDADGSLCVCFRAAGSLEMDWHLHTWGADVTVVQPPPEVFRDKVLQQREQWRTYFR